MVISSWWPTKDKSVGTFVELHVQGLLSRGCKCPVLLVSENSLGTFAKDGFKSKRMEEFRKSEEIDFIEVPVVHKKILKYSKDPNSARRKNILKQVEKKIRDYVSINGKPDYIFHHGVFDYCYLTVHIAEQFNIPIWYMENSPNISSNNIPCANDFDSVDDLKKFVGSVERRFAVTEDYVKKMESVFNCSFELCPNILTDNFFIDPKLRKAPTGYFQFINVAILEERKNQELLIRAFARKFSGQKDVKLVIAGDGRLRSYLKELSEELGVLDQVSIPGFVGRKQLENLLDESHCFVLSSRAETFGVVVIEAMARCLPVISSDIPGTREIINDSNGILFEEGNVEDLISKMEYVHENYYQFEPSQISSSIIKRYGPNASYNVLFPNV